MHPTARADASFPIAIIGAGALGLTIAARLAATTRVAVITRDAARAARLRAGLRVGDRLRTFEAFGPDALPRADWVLVLVKADATEAACRVALALRPQGVLSLQNGLIDDRVRAACAPVPAAQGVTTMGAYRESSGADEQVVAGGEGEILLPPGFEAVADLLARAGLAARVIDDIVGARMAKLLVNLAINPTTAVFGVHNGALADPPLRAIVQALVREAWPLLRVEGLRLDRDAAMARVFDVVSATATNRSSMLQDVRAGRPTEADAITGALLALAQRVGTRAPTHQALYTLLQHIAARPDPR